MKKSLLQMITLALVVVNLVISVIVMLTCMPAIKKTGALVDKVCEVVDLNVIGAADQSETVAVENLEEVAVRFSGDSTETTVNLKTDVDGKNHVLLVSVTLVLNKTHQDYAAKSVTVNSAMGMINSAVIETLSKYTMSEANNNKFEIKKEILGQIRQIFNSDFIYDVSFTQFVFQ